jgi:hypothetical protein
MNIVITPSNKTNKKYAAIIDNGKKTKTIHFGAANYEDFTIHKDPLRKKAYLARHKHDKYNNPLFAGFYATNLYWNKKTFQKCC